MESVHLTWGPGLDPSFKPNRLAFQASAAPRGPPRPPGASLEVPRGGASRLGTRARVRLRAALAECAPGVRRRVGVAPNTRDV